MAASPSSGERGVAYDTPGDGGEPDFRGLDFARIWSGRPQVTTLEGRVLGRALEPADRRRVLEVGCGEGRLTPTVQRGAMEYVAIDVVPEFLAKLPAPGPGGPRSLKLVADVRRLPFRSESMTACVMVRAFNFLPDPQTALGEIHRVLVPGGRAVVTSGVHPSLGSLVDDVRYTLRPPDWSSYRRVGLDHSARRETSPTVFPTWTWSRRALRDLVTDAGFSPVAEYATGLEEYPGLRRFPAGLFEPLAEVAGSHCGLPMRWLVLERPGGAPGSLCAWSELLACPRCRAPAAADAGTRATLEPCAGCGFRFRQTGGMLDAR
jgi:SAM-dependent methyltransferase